MGQSQRSGSNFLRTAGDIRSSALPSTVKSNKSHYQSKVCVCNQWAYADNFADAVDRLLRSDVFIKPGCLENLNDTF